MRPSLTLLPLLCATAPFAAANNNGPAAVVINEIRIDQPFADDDEYFELAGAPGTSLDGLWYLVIGDSGAGSSGFVERAYDLTGFSIPASGYFVGGLGGMTLGTPDFVLPQASNAFENDDNVTHMLVDSFTGAEGDDLDTDEDGVFDVTPWTAILDDVSVLGNPNEQGDQIYSLNVVAAFGFGAGADVGHVERCPDMTGPFVAAETNDSAGEDTVGAANLCPPPLGDDCNFPETIDAILDPIPNIGTFVFDNTNADDTAFGGMTCATTMSNDVFFVWVCPSDGDYTFDTCGSLFDTRLAVHAGLDCSATCIDENDDSCGVQSLVSAPGLVAGNAILIQIGGAGPLEQGIGICTITKTSPLPLNDTCATPQVISGLGTFAYDRTAATTSAFDGGDAATCANFQNDSSPHRDVFFAWTSAGSGSFQFDNCMDGGDTAMNVHTGADCSATCVASNDDGACSMSTLGESTVIIGGISPGDQFLIQIGDWGTDASVGLGNLNITSASPPPANNDCSTPELIVGEGNFAFDTTSATNSNFDGGGPACNGAQNGVPPNNDVFFAWSAVCDGDYLFTTCGQMIDTEFSIHLGSDCSATCIADEGDNDNSCGGPFFEDFQHTELGVTAGTSYLLQLGGWSGVVGAGTLDITNVSGGCTGGGTISVLCDPAINHFQGNFVKLETSSFGSGVGSGFHIEAIDGPSGEFGFVLVADNGNAGIPVFGGVLCLGSPQGRYNPGIATNQGLPQLNSIGQFDGAGVLQSLAGNATSSGGSGYDVPVELPFSPPGQTILAASTWFFQVWYRDQIAMPGDSANFSNMIEVTFP